MNTSLDRRIAGNPLLGPDWSPLVDVLEIVMKTVFLAPHWTLHIYGEAYGFDPVVTPGAQCVLEADGSLTVEVTGPSPRHLTHFAEALEFVGWEPPVDEFGVLHDNKNANRTFLPGWTERIVAVALLEVLTSVYSIGREDFFHFGEKVADDVERLGLLERAGAGPQFRLITVAKTPEAVEDEDAPAAVPEVNQEPVSADEALVNRAAVLEVSELDRSSTRGARFTNRDFTNQDLAGIDFTGASLTDVAFRGANLRGANFSSTHLDAVDFVGADLRDALFDDCVADRAVNFSRSDLSNASFVRASLPGTWFVRAELQNAAFENADLASANFYSAALECVNFAGANLSGADCGVAVGSEVNLDGANLTSANFNRADFRRTDFTKSTLGGTDFSFAVLVQSTFAGMVLAGNDFSGATLEQAELQRTDFRHTLVVWGETLSFYGAALSGAKFDGQDLRQADFTEADVSDASFVDCKVGGADFTRAETGGSDFVGADFTEGIFAGDGLGHPESRSMSAEARARRAIAETEDEQAKYWHLTDHWILLHWAEPFHAAQNAAVAALAPGFGERDMMGLQFSVSGHATGDASKYARTAAALGLKARDLISQEGFTQKHYDLLVLLWATHFDLAHPADTRPRLAIWGDEAEFGPETNEIRRVLRWCAHMSVRHFEQLVSIEREEDDGDVLVAELSAFRALRRSNRELQWFDLQQLIDELPGAWGAGPASDDDNWGRALRCIRLVVHGLLVRDCISERRFETMANIWREYDWRFLQRDVFDIE